MISGVASAVPELVVGYAKALRGGDEDLISRLCARVEEFVAWCEEFPAPMIVREAANLRGLRAGAAAAPLGPGLQSRLEEFRLVFPNGCAALRRRQYSDLMGLPNLMPVHQNIPSHALKDVAGEVRRQLALSGFAARVPPGARIAIGAGSRGISNIATIVRGVADYWREAGCNPFIFPAMGSHGAATAEGQALVLAHYGIENRPWAAR